MGIDVYMAWSDMTEEEEKARYTGFSTHSGHVGYLREAYHGGPYATNVLLPECFQDGNNEHQYDGADLRARLPETVFAALYREAHVYHEDARAGLYEGGMEDLPNVLNKLFDNVQALNVQQSADTLQLTDNEAMAYAMHHMTEWVEQGKDALPPVAKAFVDFVELAENKTQEEGELVTIYASY